MPPPDLRSPIDLDAVTAVLTGPWNVSHVLTTGSTNADLVSADPADRSVLVTEEQTAGRGRLGRVWTAPPGSSLMFSVALRVPGVPAPRRGWIGALLGLSLIEAIRATGPEGRLKWPNDLLIDGRKCAGILAETSGDLVVAGAGLNVSTTRKELPRADATSLALSGATRLDRAALLAGALNAFGPRVDSWRAAGGDVVGTGLQGEYRRACVTLGSQVRIELPGGSVVTGRAVDLDRDGGLVIEKPDGTKAAFAAGDVIHLRPTPRG